MLILTKHEMDCSVKEDNHWNPALWGSYQEKLHFCRRESFKPDWSMLMMTWHIFGSDETKLDLFGQRNAAFV